MIKGFYILGCGPRHPSKDGKELISPNQGLFASLGGVIGIFAIRLLIDVGLGGLIMRVLIHLKYGL